MLKRKQFYIQVWVYPFPFSPPFTFLKLAMSSSNKRLIPKGGPRTSTSTKTEWWTVMAVNPDYASHSATKSIDTKSNVEGCKTTDRVDKTDFNTYHLRVRGPGPTSHPGRLLTSSSLSCHLKPQPVTTLMHQVEPPAHDF